MTRHKFRTANIPIPNTLSASDKHTRPETLLRSAFTWRFVKGTFAYEMGMNGVGY